MSDYIEKFVLPSLIYAQDFAFIEDAPGTYEVLQLIEKVLRYASKDTMMDILDNEIDIMYSILNLLRYRYGNFQFEIKTQGIDKSLDIKRFYLIQKIEPIISEVQSDMHNYQEILLNIFFDQTTNQFNVKRGI